MVGGTLEIQPEITCSQQAPSIRKRAFNTMEDGLEEEVEQKKEKMKRGKLVVVKEEKKDSNEVVVEVRIAMSSLWQGGR